MNEMSILTSKRCKQVATTINEMAVQSYTEYNKWSYYLVPTKQQYTSTNATKGENHVGRISVVSS
jgi:hypothetical protein